MITWVAQQYQVIDALFVVACHHHRKVLLRQRCPR
jgi:hypothetical protein